MRSSCWTPLGGLSLALLLLISLQFVTVSQGYQKDADQCLEKCQDQCERRCMDPCDKPICDPCACHDLTKLYIMW